MTRSFMSVGAVFLLLGAARAADVFPPARPLTVSVQQEWIGTAEPGYRIFVCAGTNRFAFGLPKGFRIEGDPATGRLRINKMEIGAFINFAFAVNSQPPGKAAVLSRYPGGRMLVEFDRPVLGRRCHGLDIEWTGVRQIRELTRVVQVPTDAGMLEISLTAGVKQFPEGERGMNILLNSLTDGGNLKQAAPNRAPISS